MEKKMTISQISIIALALVVLGGLVFASCKTESKKITKVTSNMLHPDWSKDAVIYEVNVRQYTPEGTLKAFENHLPRLKEMGVDILWLMPVHPIGEKNRKGGMGSYYSVRDYTAVNPEFGTLDDFKDLVNAAHELGMYVILDWVANHTAWDHAWVVDHPEWYSVDEKGNMVSPYDWSDVADLNYSNDDLREAMLDALKFWVVEADIDGYRCDVAGMVPVEFWNNARVELDKIKPVFMLAEAEQPNHHIYAFDMSYAWELHHIMNEIAQGKKNAKAFDNYFKKHDTLYPANAYRMYFITNHDENSWNGTEYERMGDAVNTFAVLTYTLPGMPLIYSGQEAALNKRLKFFEKDTIDWGAYELADFYRRLGQLRKENPALWSGEAGGSLKFIKTSDNESVLCFFRKKDNEAVMVMANLTDSPKSFTMKTGRKDGKKNMEMELTDWFSGEVLILKPGEVYSLMPWGYRILTGGK
ncbi:MAG: alpha-glucosidase C-terminal domain-containing protein [Bacteroidetes bacterium]|nr:alpha-glucosidase C-terminal domain-containing protein [Bacteroidota bacterium]